MARLIVQAGALTVVVKDDRALLEGEDLKLWRKAATQIITDVASSLTIEEEVDDGE